MFFVFDRKPIFESLKNTWKNVVNRPWSISMPLVAVMRLVAVDVVYIWKVWSCRWGLWISRIEEIKQRRKSEIYGKFEWFAHMNALFELVMQWPMFTLPYVILLEGRLDGNQWDSLLLSFWAGEGHVMVCRWGWRLKAGSHVAQWQSRASDAGDVSAKPGPWFHPNVHLSFWVMTDAWRRSEGRSCQGDRWGRLHDALLEASRKEDRSYISQMGRLSTWSGCLVLHSSYFA